MAGLLYWIELGCKWLVNVYAWSKVILVFWKYFFFTFLNFNRLLLEFVQNKDVWTTLPYISCQSSECHCEGIALFAYKSIRVARGQVSFSLIWDFLTLLLFHVNSPQVVFLKAVNCKIWSISLFNFSYCQSISIFLFIVECVHFKRMQLHKI